MEDSLQLPQSQQDNQEINFFVSPNNSMKKPKLQLINTASQESLAYSSETHMKLINTERSPIEFRIPNFQSSEKPISVKKLMKTGKLKSQKSPQLKITQSQKYLLIQERNQPNLKKNELEDRRKTMNKTDFNILNKKYKELQYALQVQVMSSEELRTKVTILSEILEHKMKQTELSYFLNLKNSSKNLKNVDIFVELKQAQRKLKQAELKIEGQREQIQSLVQQCLSKTERKQKQNIDLSNMDPSDQIAALIEEKESLFNFIQQMRKQYNTKHNQCILLSEQLKRYEQKQQKFIAIQRPKLIQELSERAQQIKQLNQEIEKLRMEKNLLELKYEGEIQQLKFSHEQQLKMKKDQQRQKEREKQKQRIQQKKQKLKETSSKQVMTVNKEMKSSMTQTDPPQELQILKTELNLLKQERDYYIKQYKKRSNQSSENYLLKMQLRVYQNKAQSNQ